jgi:hypothetical protein
MATKQGLLAIIEELEEGQQDCMFDLQQDWNEEKELMTIQLGLLTDAIVLLELIASKPDSQLFSSSMSI